ncbi:hypothetical protein EON66_09545 [archaeon]|nr:MAG: hypothetical protein EON66_09545 [archaeon]
MRVLALHPPHIAPRLPYVQHSEEDEPSCPERFDFSFERYELTKKNLQLLMFEQIGVRVHTRTHPRVPCLRLLQVWPVLV